MSRAGFGTFLAAFLTVMGACGPRAYAGTDPYIGQMIWVPYNFAPVGWARCDGSMLSISAYPELFAVIGTTFGGDGQTIFALPNLNGRIAVHRGQGPGLSNYVQGQTGGEATHTLTMAEVPAHSHSVPATTAVNTQTTPAGALPGQSAAGLPYGGEASVAMAPSAVAATGGGLPHNNMMPTIELTCIIATIGISP